MHCKNCGTAVEQHHNYCTNCGNLLNESESPCNTKKQPTTRWFKIVLSLIFTGLAFTVISVLLSNDITDVVAEQLEAIKEKKITEAYYNYTSKDFQDTTSLEHFQEFIHNYPIFSNAKSVRFIDRNVVHDTASLQALIQPEEGNEVLVHYGLIKKNDHWKIVSIKMEDNAKNLLKPKSG